MSALKYLNAYLLRITGLANVRERIEEHGTILTGIGLHQGQNKTIIYVTVDAGKIDLLKNLITKYDPDAFMIITEASEFLGRGLK